MDLKTALAGKIPKKDMLYVSGSFEVVGDIALIEVPKNIISHEATIAKTLAEINSNVNIVLSKKEDVEGAYRVPKYGLAFERDAPRDFSWVPKGLRPKEKTETVHKENGIRLLIDPTKAYFTEKLAFERERISSLVNDGERILVMFAGVGPFPVVIAKKKKVAITAVELNPDAVGYFRKNVELNRLDEKIAVLEGNVADVVPGLEGGFDRVIMPAPKNAEDFLDLALDKVKKNGTIHLYMFLPEEEIPRASRRITERCKKLGHVIEVSLVRKCGNIGPYHYRVVADFKVSG